jgi:hypothetical protein
MGRERNAQAEHRRSAEGDRPGSRLDPDEIEAIAHRVTELLAPRLREPGPVAPRRLLSAAEVAEWWGIDRSWVYGHANELGAIRLGSGRRPRLRFDPDLVAERFSARAGRRAPGARGRHRGRRSRRISADSVDLLPLRGDPELRSSTPNRGRPGGATTSPAAAPKAKASAR